MKLIMENWRNHLQEEEHRQQILDYLAENNIVLTEEELEEAMPKWLQRFGATAALVGSLMGTSAPAMAADTNPASDTEVATMQVDAEESSEAENDADAGLGYIKGLIDTKTDIKDKSNTEFKTMNVQKALDALGDGDTSQLENLSDKEHGLLDFILNKVDKVQAEDAKLYNQWREAGAKINIRECYETPT